MSPVGYCILAFICMTLGAAEQPQPYRITVLGTQWTGIQCSQEASCVTFVSDVSISIDNHYSNGDGVLVPSGCSSPRSIPNANVSAPSRQEGDIASYTCNINYGFCRKVDNTRTCLKSGDWSTLDPSAVCHQIYWDKLSSVPVAQKFPCTAHRGTQVTVKGVPTRKRNRVQGDEFRIEVYLKLGRDVSHAYIGFSSPPQIVVTNDNVRGKWGQSHVKRKGFFPFKVDQPFEMVFTIQLTRIVVTVDSRVVAMHSFKTGVPSIDGIRIQQNVRVSCISIKYTDRHCQSC